MVAAAPLGDLIETDEANSARLIKIDVEGAEDNVLSGIVPLLDQLSDDVEFLVELSPHWWSDKAKTPEGVLRPFREAGFHVYAMRVSLHDLTWAVREWLFQEGITPTVGIWEGAGVIHRRQHEKYAEHLPRAA